MSLVGKPNFRAAIKAKADTVKIHAREVLELAAGGENYIGNTAQNPSKYGAVHIIAGNRIGDSASDFSLQPIPKGNNLREFLEQQIEFIQNLTSVQQQTIEEIISLRTTLTAAGTALAGGVGPALLAAVPAAGNLLVAAMATASPKTALVLSNNLGVGVNNTLFKTNYLKEYSPKFILSKFNKVN